MRYPGGKGVSGVYQRLINQIPPHRVYIETHLGGGAILRHKRPAAINIGIDRDPEVLASWRPAENIQLICADAVEFLADYSFKGDEFIYADPPYLDTTRRSSRSPYRMSYTDSQHVSMLAVITRIPCRVMVSGYRSALYDEKLSGWRRMSFSVRTRSGAMAEETIWMNYPEPEELHDYRYLGATFRERERIRRRVERWKSRIASLPPLERGALITEIASS